MAGKQPDVQSDDSPPDAAVPDADHMTSVPPPIPALAPSRYPGWLVGLTLLAVVLLVGWHAFASHQNFRRDQQVVLERSAAGAANELMLLVEQLGRAMRLFAKEEALLLARLADHPGDEVAARHLAGDLATFFPELAGFGVVNGRGELVFRSAGIGPALSAERLDNIRGFTLADSIQAVCVHPGANGAQFDLLVPWAVPAAQRSGSLLTSFHAEMVVQRLRHHEVPDHRLLLIRNDRPDFIEATTQGVGVAAPQPFEEAARRRGVAREVDGTLWSVVAVPTESLESDQLRALLVQSLVPISGFLLIAAVLLRMIRREERRRATAEQALLRSHGSLEQRVEERTRELHESRAQINYLEQHDPLTGLPNRDRLIEQLDELFTRPETRDRSRVLLCIGLDRFKHLNDTLGYAVGDQLIQIVAEQLRARVRQSDLVARLGGSEFVLVLNEIGDEDTAVVVSDKIRAAVARPYDLGAGELYASASVGIVLCPAGAPAEAPDTLIRNAQAALHQAKEAGGNRHQFFTSDLGSRARAHLELERSLRRALEHGEFELHYQPKIGVQDGGLTGLEALLRWRHPQRGLVSPAEFIPLLEDTGLIGPVGNWVLREACQFNARRGARGLAPLPVAVNLSVRQLGDRQIVRHVVDALEAAVLDPEYLELEITESALLSGETAINALKILRGMGVRVAIDDFGTGYSSLGYLRRLPIDTLKIDRSFLTDVEHDRDQAAIVQAALAMARSLRLRVVAEGVETDAQLSFLRAFGCEEAQGFYFSRPLPEAALHDWLTRRSPSPA